MSDPARLLTDYPAIFCVGPDSVPSRVIAFGGVDQVAPVIDNFSPPNGSVIERADPIFFDVTDNTGLFRRVIVLVRQGGRWEAAFDGDDLLEGYLSSSVVNITDGFRFSLRRDEEWAGPVTVRVFAIDRSGNEG